jgi:hypothetical protein
MRRQGKNGGRGPHEAESGLNINPLGGADCHLAKVEVEGSNPFARSKSC